MKNINTYLIFEGKCRQAMEFYQQCLGGKLHMMPYSQAPGCADMPKEFQNWIIHARLNCASTVLMASDTKPGVPVTSGNNFFISIDCENLPEIEKLFKALGVNGNIDMPLQETFFAIRFGMLTDQFGVKWMFNLEKKQE